jgi:branched-chain amino acid transport system permease protein
MDLFLVQLLNGLVYGMLLFLMAAGLSLIFGLMNVVSLAHGSFFMLGAYIGLSIYQITNNFWLALVLAPIPTAALGMAVEILFLRPLYRRGHLDQVLMTFGFTFVFFDLVRTIWGSNIKNMAMPEALQGAVQIGAGIFPVYRLFLIAVGLALALILWLCIERTRIGAMVRAGVDDSAMASGLGANVPLLFTGVFGVGVALAAIGGVVAGPIMGLYPGMDSEVMIPAFIVIVVGGMGSLRGAFIGSILIGMADTFGKTYVPSMALFLIYLVMAVVLLTRPQGFFGVKHMGSSGSSAARNPIATLSTPRSRIVGTVVLAAMAIAPLFVGNHQLTIVSEIFIFAILAMSLDILLGFTGLPSMGHAAFFGLGAYAVIVLATLFNLDPWLGVAAGVLLAAAASAFVGYFCVSASGITFLMLTLAFSQLAYSVALKWRDVTGGSDGIGIPEKPAFLIWSLENRLVMYYMTFAFFVLCYLGLKRLIGSPLGHVLVGIRENEGRMLAIGHNTQGYKLLAFIISGTIAGFAGGLYAIFNGFISPDAIHWSASGDILIMVMLGGGGTLIGPAIGAAIFLLMKNLVSSYSDHWMLIIGCVFIGCVLFFPEGLWGTFRRLKPARAS